MVIVVGSRNSSNSNRLREVAQNNGTIAYMVDNASQIDLDWLKDGMSIGVTAGASAPEILVQQVIERLMQLGMSKVRELDGVREGTIFPMPKGLGGSNP
jgi:4-hydroxy-3-methylbut-2-enyl diphosphate reductase